MLKTNLNISQDELLKKRKILKSEILGEYNSKYENVQVTVGSETIEMSKGLLLLNMFLLEPLIKHEMTVDKSDLYIHDNVTQFYLNEHFNKMLDKYLDNADDYNSIRFDMFEVLNKLSDISAELNIMTGNTISLYDFIKTSVEDPEMRKIFFHKSEFGKQFSEIEDEYNEIGNKLIDYYKNNKESDLYPFVTSGTGINKKQLIQAIGMVGLKPDIDGKVIPVVIDENYLRGFTNLENYFINAKGTRLALLTNRNYVRASGYLTRKLSLSNIDNYHDNTIEDCGTKHFIKFECNSNKKLNQILGRQYYDLDKDLKPVGELKTVKSDSDIMNKTIGLRSPETCASEKTCSTCYGRRLSKINSEVNTGLVAVHELTDPLTQNILSVKHLLTTNTESIKWGEIIDDNMILDMEHMYFGETDVTITVKHPPEENFDEDEDAYFIDNFIITVSKKSVQYKSPVKLYLNPELFDLTKDLTETTLESVEIGEYKPIFRFIPNNRAITKSLQQIIDLVESADHLGISDYNGMANKFSDLLIDNGMDYIRLVHAQTILKELIKDPDGNRLDFTKEDPGDYEIWRVTKNVLNGEISKSLLFERLNEQISDLKTYEKGESSLLDYLFR